MESSVAESIAINPPLPRVPKPKGGARPGAGRKPKPRNPTLLEKAYGLLDEATIPAIKAIVLLTKSRNPMVRLHAAKVVLAKTIPDKIKLNGNGLGETHYHYTTINVDAKPEEVVSDILAELSRRPAVASA